MSKKFSVRMGYRVLSESCDTERVNQYFKHDVGTQALVFRAFFQFLNYQAQFITRTGTRL